jgi:hypothetical protein
MTPSSRPVRGFGLDLVFGDGPDGPLAERQIEGRAGSHAPGDSGFGADDRLGYRQHVSRWYVPVDRNDRADQKPAPGTGEVDADGARPAGLGDELAVAGIAAR